MATRDKRVEIATLEGGSTALSTSELDQLDARLDGSLLRPGERGWDEAIRVWNAMVTKTPALVVQPRSSGDVSAAVTFAAQHGLRLSVKGGGHNIAGTSIAEGGVTLDMSQLRDVSVDPQRRLAQVGPGCRLGEVDAATQEHGLATTLGFVSETGVAGLTLGGGFGYLMRQFGWTVDNLEEVEIVTADGAVRTASKAHHPDLFWAIRGGGGNFGIVTRFTFRLQPVGPMVMGGLMIWPAAMAEQVLDVYRLLTDVAPRALTAAVMIRLAPPAPFVPEEMHFEPVIGTLVCHTGPEPERDLAPLRNLPLPIVDLVAERSYAEQQSMLDDLDPAGLNQYWKTEFLPGLSSGFLDNWRRAALKVASPMSYSVVFHIGGASNEIREDECAVGNRDARFVSGFSGVWPPGEDGRQIVTAVREGWESIRPYSTGGNYVNFQLEEDTDERTAAAYRENVAKLRRVKLKYDPGNLFRSNRNISPAHA